MVESRSTAMVTSLVARMTLPAICKAVEGTVESKSTLYSLNMRLGAYGSLPDLGEVRRAVAIAEKIVANPQHFAIGKRLAAALRIAEPEDISGMVRRMLNSCPIGDYNADKGEIESNLIDDLGEDISLGALEETYRTVRSVKRPGEYQRWSTAEVVDLARTYQRDLERKRDANDGLLSELDKGRALKAQLEAKEALIAEQQAQWEADAPKRAAEEARLKAEKEAAAEAQRQEEQHLEALREIAKPIAEARWKQYADEFKARFKAIPESDRYQRFLVTEALYKNLDDFIAEEVAALRGDKEPEPAWYARFLELQQRRKR
jgi:hypothetical protein